jgi:hypothetical protein
MVIKLCVNRSRYKFVAIYRLCAVFVQIYVCIDLCDPVNMVALLIYITEYLILFTENEFVVKCKVT